MFLDTNVIQWLERFGESVFDNYLPDGERDRIAGPYGEHAVRELEALQDIVAVLQRGSIPVAVSEVSLEEFLRLRNSVKGSKLIDWVLELLYWWRTNRDAIGIRIEEQKAPEHLVRSGRLNFLPDYPDRLLVAEAIVFGCDTFLTLDRRTILRFKRQIKAYGPTPLSPLEFSEMYL